MSLKKELGALGVFSFAAGSMISTGLFVLPAIAFKEAGAGIVLAYLFAGIIMIPALLSQIELATAIPKAGGTYFFSDRILGPVAGAIAGFANWFSISLKSAFALVGIGALSYIFFPHISQFTIKIISAIFCIAFVMINLFSLKVSGRIQIYLVIFLLLILGAFILIGYKMSSFTNIQNILTGTLDWKAIIATTGMVFISYGGLTKIASIAEEVKNPQKNLIKGSFLAFLVVQAIYIFSVIILIGILPAQSLSNSYTPISDAAKQMSPHTIFGTIGYIVLTIAAILAFVTTANAGIMAASRVPLAMSRDELLPKFFSKVSKKRRIPILSVLVTGLFMLIIILSVDIKNLAKIASLFMILLFFLLNLEVIIIRVSKISNYKPSFKSPFFPVIQVLGMIFYLLLIIGMGYKIIAISLGFIALSIIWYFIYSKNKIKRKSAFVHMIENITAPEFKANEKELENELLDILMEGKDIIEDRFDAIIRQAPVIDLNEKIDRKTLFKKIAEVEGKKWNIPPYKLEAMLNIREETSSTLLYPGVAVPHAIPHVIIEGEHRFDIVLVRNKQDIVWNEQGECVHTVFCLIGSKDERHFHLKALSAIAQILMDPNFQSEWHNAKDSKDLRSTILLTKRKRKQ